MALDQSLYPTLQANVLADPVLSLLPHNSDSAFEIARIYNLDASPDFFVWRSTTGTPEIFNAITWKNLTPTDTADATVTYTNRVLACQAKQMNLQIILQGQATIASGKANIQQGLKDALQNVPAGASGALLDAGWAAVKAVMTRKATRAEKLFAVGTGTTGSPADLVFEGTLDYNEVKAAMGW